MEIEGDTDSEAARNREIEGDTENVGKRGR